MFDNEFTPCQYQFSVFVVVVFKVTCLRMVALCQTNILQPLSNMLSDNKINFNQRKVKAVGVPIIPLGLFFFIVGKRNNKKINYFVALVPDKENLVSCSAAFLGNCSS